MVVSGLYVFANAYACVVLMTTFSTQKIKASTQMMVKNATLLRRSQRRHRERNSWHPMMATPAQKYTHMGGPQSSDSV